MACLCSYPIGGEYVCLTLPTQYMYLIQSGNDLQDLYPAPCPLAIKIDQGPTFEGSALLGYQEVSLLYWQVPLSPTALINFVLLLFCFMSGNSFPTHAQIMTFTLLKKL